MNSLLTYAYVLVGIGMAVNSQGNDILGLASLFIFFSPSFVLMSSGLAGMFNSSSGPMSQWMSNLSDSMPLQNISIPGTHDSAACER